MVQLLDQFGRPLVVPKAPPAPMRASIEAGRLDNEGIRSWKDADSLGPNAALDQATRGRLRDRGRYETLNNSYCRGLVRSLAYDLVGTGPKLKLTIPGDEDGSKSKAVRKRWGKWARATLLALKFRIMEKAAAREGNAFGLFDTDEDLLDQVKLDLRLVEDEQCDTPPSKRGAGSIIDGIEINQRGKPARYWFLRNHPGENTYFTGDGDYFSVPAKQVIHWFERDRAGQLRGVPRIVAGLPTFGKTRRFSEATITAAEFAASIIGMLESTLPAGEQPVDLEAMDTVEIVKQMLLTMPKGWKANQLKAEHPGTTYSEFVKEKHNEAGRGTGAPLNVVSGNSSGYNFSSGRLDHLPYQRGLTIDRDDFRNIVADPVFRAWEAEGRLVAGYFPEGLPPIDDWEWGWFWDAFDSIDQNKDADADDTRIRNGTSTYDEIHGAYGDDWEEKFEQVAREKAKAESLGLPYPLLFAPPTANANAPAGQDTTDTADTTDGEPGTQPGASADDDDDTVLETPRGRAAITGGRR